MRSIRDATLTTPCSPLAGALAEPPELTVVVPTRNEAANVEPLLERLREALTGLSSEVLFVDDSDDATPSVVEAAARRPGLAVRLLHRTPQERCGGLGGAVVAGLAACRSDWVVVMDGDLQHPPEVVPALLRAGRESGADLVVGSRHIGAADAGGLAGPWRHLASGGATLTARMLFPKALRDVTDPMSGFFALRREAVDLGVLRPRGFKILLELAVRSGPLRVTEVPFSFGPREAGVSKAGLREAWRFLRQLMQLRLAPATLRAIAFGAVGVSGLAVNLAAVWLLVGMGLSYVLAAVLATQVSSLWNALLCETLVFAAPARGTPARRLGTSMLLNNVLLLLRVPLLVLLVDVAGMHYLPATALTLVAAFVLRFYVSDHYIYVTGGNEMKAETSEGQETPRREPVDIVIDLTPQAVQPHATTRYLPHRYDVAGVISVGSEVALEELEWFRSASVGRDVDIEIRVGDVGGGPRWHSRLTRTPSARSVTYEEHLGRLGANFRVDMNDRIDVTVGPLLAHSPHVLYTNVIEALLRFVMVSRGKMLLHSACLDFGGRGLLMSARTDTGKTGTVLRMLREHNARFLSDDMTILDENGRAQWFPKPLTISNHTLRAVQVSDLCKREWRRLRIQSKLHSKEGRAFGTALAEHNLPIMGVNALTQIAVPPPKYAVERLVDCELVATTQVRDLFIIQRGAPSLEHLTPEAAVDELIENTDDAYGFPPFRWFAPAVVLGSDDYEALRAKERHLLELALRTMRIRRLSSDSFSWADDIALFMGATAAAASRDRDLRTASELRRKLVRQRSTELDELPDGAGIGQQ